MLYYMTLFEFTVYDPITLLSLLYDFKWWYNVLHGRFNLETWNYLCIHTQSYFTDPQKLTLKDTVEDEDPMIFIGWKKTA